MPIFKKFFVSRVILFNPGTNAQGIMRGEDGHRLIDLLPLLHESALSNQPSRHLINFSEWVASVYI